MSAWYGGGKEIMLRLAFRLSNIEVLLTKQGQLSVQQMEDISDFISFFYPPVRI